MTMKEILADIKSNRVKKVILDTDTANEIDDQYAMGFCYMSEKMELLSVNAAPFTNEKTDDYAHGADMSYDEARKTLALIDPDYSIPVYRGSRETIEHSGKPYIESEAADNIIKTVRESDEIIYVLAIATLTNVASAIVKAPDIKDNMCVIWAGGNWLEGDNLGEFNLVQDYTAGQLVLNSGVPFVMCPAWCVVSELNQRFEYFEKELTGVNPLCDYLLEITTRCYELAGKPHWWTRTIWDIAVPAILHCPECADLEIIKAPIFTDARVYAFDSTRHEIIYLSKIDKDITYENAMRELKRTAPYAR